MPYFFSQQNLSAGQTLELGGEEARHILVLRPRLGEKIKLQGPNGKRFLCKISEIKKSALVIEVIEAIAAPNELSVEITLFQAVVSEKALDFIFQKSTELGVKQIVLFNSKNTATKLSAEKFKSKQERWNKILMGAAKQCERSIWPVLGFVADLGTALPQLKNYDKVFLTDISGKTGFNHGFQASKVAIVVGPEGGFAQEEIKKLASVKNLEILCMSPFMLRAETAAIAACAILGK